MKLNDDPESSTDSIIPSSSQSSVIAVIVDQLLQQMNHDIKLTTGVSGQDSRVAAGRDSRRINDEAAHHLRREYYFIDGAGAAVELENPGEERRQQRLKDEVGPHDFGRQEGLYETIAESAAVKSDGTDARQPTAHVGVATHYKTQILVADIAPVRFH